VHDEHVAWRRGGRARGQDDQYSGLSIEFDDEDTEASSTGTDAGADTGTDAGTEATAADGAPPSEVVAGQPASRWSRIPLRHRVTAVAAVLVLAVGSVVAVRLELAARQRAREQFALAVVDDRYQPAISQVGLNMALTLVNHGPAMVTVDFLQVSQPGLRLAFYPVQVPLPVGKPFAFTLVGVFDCQGTVPTVAAADASTVEVTVSSQTGISSVTLGLKPGSVPPKGWQDQRSAFCATSNTGR
jgi:hypothetical protein